LRTLLSSSVTFAFSATGVPVGEQKIHIDDSYVELASIGQAPKDMFPQEKPRFWHHNVTT
jgi:hypothetical protein